MSENMTQDERLDLLVEEFRADSEMYKNSETPKDKVGKRRFLRSLMNIRMPKPMPKDVIKVQDDYLKERIEENGIVRLSDIPVIRGVLSLWQGDHPDVMERVIFNVFGDEDREIYDEILYCG